jgi:hypothetical protein
MKIYTVYALPLPVIKNIVHTIKVGPGPTIHALLGAFLQAFTHDKHIGNCSR